MNKQYLLNEDTLPPKLPAIYSEEIKNDIEIIKEYNQFEKQGLLELDAYIKWLESHITNRSIAFNYGRNFTVESDGAIFIDYLGVRFRIEDDSKRVFVKITWIDMKLEDYGLEAPPSLMENNQHNTSGMKHTIYLKESNLRRIIVESLKSVFKDLSMKVN